MNRNIKINDDGTVSPLDPSKPFEFSPDIEYPATCLVHWPSGAVPCCDTHKDQLIGLGNFLGSHIVATHLLSPAECMNCVNEAKSNV